MNVRAKGRWNEERGCRRLKEEGYIIFRLTQPKTISKNAIDAIAVKENELRFIEFRTNSWHDLKPTKAFGNLVSGKLKVSVECWKYMDGQEHPIERIIANNAEYL